MFINGTHSGATAALAGTLASASLLVNGAIFYYRTPTAVSNSAQTLTLTFTDGSTSQIISLYTDTATTSTIPFTAGSILILVYYNGVFYVVNDAHYADGDGVSY